MTPDEVTKAAETARSENDSAPRERNLRCSPRQFTLFRLLALVACLSVSFASYRKAYEILWLNGDGREDLAGYLFLTLLGVGVGIGQFSGSLWNGIRGVLWVVLVWSIWSLLWPQVH